MLDKTVVSSFVKGGLRKDEQSECVDSVAQAIDQLALLAR